MNDNFICRIKTMILLTCFLSMSAGCNEALAATTLTDQQHNKPQSTEASPVERLQQLVNAEIALSAAKLGKVTVVGHKGKYIATQIFHPFDDLKPKALSVAASRGWTAGQLVKIWVYKDWTFQVCGNLFRQYEGCVVIPPQNSLFFLKYEIRNMIHMLNGRSYGDSKRFIEKYAIESELREGLGEKAFEGFIKDFHERRKGSIIHALEFILDKSPSEVENKGVYNFALPEKTGFRKNIRFFWDQHSHSFRLHNR